MSDSISKIIYELNNKNFKKALELSEKYSENNNLHILNNLKGIIFINLKDHTKAIEYFQESINHKEDYLEGYSNLANAYFSTKNFSKSINTIIKALNYDPKNKNLHFNLAFFFSENSQYQKAVEQYNKAMKFGYNKEIVLNNIGNIYIKEKNYSKAEEYFLECLKISSSNYLTINNLIRSLILKRDFAKAEKYQKLSDKLEIKNNIYFINKAELLFFRKKYEQSENILEEFCKKDKYDVGANISLSLIYSNLGKFKNSNKLIEDIYKINPNNNTINLIKSMNLLKYGNFKEGWKLYNKSLQIKDNYYSTIPFWQGEKLEKKKLIVYEDQGIGDSIQFSKFLFYLNKLCNDIRIEVRKSVVELFQTNILNLKVYKKSSNLNSDCDYKISFASLNNFFYENKNKKEKKLFEIEKETILKWAKKINSKKLKVGLTWSGNLHGVNEPYRSIQLDRLKKIFSLDCEFFCLQKDIWDRDKKYFENSKINYLGDNNFLEIAAIIENLDLVISSDTSTLHLSSTLEKLTWGLISFNPEWRWWKYNNPPFYKKLVEYKQDKFDDWDLVVNNIFKDLKKIIDIKNQIK
jgi:tetratricopeptide (TPR) repeat protein